MGCLLVILGGLFPRLTLFIVWVARPALVNAAFATWIWPLLGIVFLPLTTLIYVLLYTPGRGLAPWEWFWVVIAGLVDVSHWVATLSRRR